jgi:hypothetical protein
LRRVDAQVGDGCGGGHGEIIAVGTGARKKREERGREKKISRGRRGSAESLG